MTNTTDIAVIEVTPELAPAIYVSGGLKGYFEQIKQAVIGEVPDLATKKGRDRVASLAAQVSRSKTAVEKPGREYLKRIKELPKEVEAELREWVRGCDELRDKVREPLTVVENQYKDRIAAILALGDAGCTDGVNSTMAADYVDKLESVGISDMWPEWQKEAQAAINSATAKAKSSLERIIKAEEAAAELTRIQAENARLEREARDRRIAEEAAERARREEAARQQAERDAAGRRELEAKRQAQEAIDREEKSRRDAEQAEIALRQAKEKMAAEAEIAEKRRVEAEVRARMDAEIAARQSAEQERQRIANERRVKDEEDARRAADIEHRRVINRKVVSDLVSSSGITEQQAIEVMKAIAGGKVEFAKINY